MAGILQEDSCFMVRIVTTWNGLPQGLDELAGLVFGLVAACLPTVSRAVAAEDPGRQGPRPIIPWAVGSRQHAPRRLTSRDG